MKAAIVVAIVGIIISATVSQLFNFGIIAFDGSASSRLTRQFLSLIGTTGLAGGLLVFFFTLLFKDK